MQQQYGSKCTKRSGLNSGFTIVELVIVVVVIAILAAIVVVAYTGVQKRALDAMVKDSVTKAGRALELSGVGTNSFASFPATLQPAQNVGLALTTVSDPMSYCINGTTPKDNSIAYYQVRGGNPQAGLCPGAVVASTIIGTYNSNALVGAVAAVPDSARVQLASSEGNFRLDTGEDWTTFTLSWDAVQGASSYEVQTQDGSNGWNWHQVSGGQPSPASGGCNNPAWSCLISNSTTSLTWTDASTRPSAAGVTHYYQWRSYNGSGYSAWQTIALTPRSTGLTQVSNTVVAAGTNWDSVTVTWNKVAGNSNIPSPRVQIQTQEGTNGWNWHQVSGGQPSPASGGCNNPAWSCDISADVISQNWTDASTKPASAGVTHYYRLRIVSSVVANMAGDWVQVSLPAPSTAQMNGKIPTFTATAANDWSSINLAWTLTGLASVPNPRIEVQTQDGSNGWNWHQVSGGQSSPASDNGGCNNAAWSCWMPTTTTSLSWTDDSTKPSAGGVTHYYRIRLVSSTMAGVTSDWQTVSITATNGSGLPTVQNFVASQSGGWSTVTLNWSAHAGSQIAVPKYEIQTRVQNGTWNWVQLSGSNSSPATGNCSNTAWTCIIAINTTSLSWTSGAMIPSPGQTLEYRIRVWSTGVPAGVTTPWATTSLSR